MSFKIVVDSCCDLPAKYRKDSRFQVIPLVLQMARTSITKKKVTKTFTSLTRSLPVVVKHR